MLYVVEEIIGGGLSSVNLLSIVSYVIAHH